MDYYKFIYLNTYFFESMALLDINVVLLNSLSQTMGYDNSCYSQFNITYESNLIISSQLFITNKIIYLNNDYLVIYNFFFAAIDLSLLILRR
jgi:hypothetical protein